MTIDTHRGSPQFPTVSGNMLSSTRDEMDAAVQTLQAHKNAWVVLSILERIAILDALIKDFAAIAPRWVAACTQAKGIAADSPNVGEEWGAGVWPVMKNLRQLRRSLADIEMYGRPRIPGPITTDEIHITGSDKTFDAIVFGTGPEGVRRKTERQPLLSKRITGELGNVSPVIVIPGPWSKSDLAYQAEHIDSMLTNNAGFNCNATRVIIQHASWPQRDQLLQRMREVLASLPPHTAYYPGAQARQRAFVEAHPEAE